MTSTDESTDTTASSTESTTTPTETTTTESSETTTTVTPNPGACDYNGDGETSVADAVLLLRYISEDSTLTFKQLTGLLGGTMDLDGDGTVTILDVRVLLQQLGA